MLRLPSGRKMTSFQIIICGFLAVILVGSLLLMLPASTAHGQWASFETALFTSVSAFCNAGFDDMGTHTGTFSSLTYFSNSLGVVLPVCALIVIGGIGFLTWGDIAFHGIHFRRYRMQSKVIIATTAGLILFPTLFFFMNDFAAYPMKQRLCLSLFQAVTPRTAGFNTVDMAAVTGVGRVYESHRGGL